MCIWGAHLCSTVHMWIQKSAYWTWFCPSALWVLGLKLKQSGLIAGAFILCAISPTQKTVIYNSDQLFFFCLLVVYLFKATLLGVLLVAVCFAGVRLTWNLCPLASALTAEILGVYASLSSSFSFCLFLRQG